MKRVEKTRDVPMNEEEIAAAEKQEHEDRQKKLEAGEKVEEPSEPPARVKKETFKDNTLEQVNSSKPMWLKDPTEVTKSEYEEFYKTLTGFTDTTPVWTHFNAEGDINFKSIMFVRGSKPQS